MENLEEIINEVSKKTEFTDEEKDLLYFTYSKNLLLASFEFKNVDSTLSALFLSLSKMLINTTAENLRHSDDELIKSRFSQLPDDEKSKLLLEIESIEKQLES